MSAETEQAAIGGNGHILGGEVPASGVFGFTEEVQSEQTVTTVTPSQPEIPNKPILGQSPESTMRRPVELPLNIKDVLNTAHTLGHEHLAAQPDPRIITLFRAVLNRTHNVHATLTGFAHHTEVRKAYLAYLGHKLDQTRRFPRNAARFIGHTTGEVASAISNTVVTAARETYQFPGRAIGWSRRHSRALGHNMVLLTRHIRDEFHDGFDILLVTLTRGNNESRLRNKEKAQERHAIVKQILHPNDTNSTN